MRVLSLCTGYGGLDLAVEAVTGAHTVAVCDNDPGASKVLALRFPHVPNLGDLKTIDWHEWAGVEVMTAGYPCQPFSNAGKRAGTDDPRHIFPDIARGIRVVGPRLVVLENVRAHLVLGFDTVLGALADIGYDARWVCLRASDVGACHRRERLFIVATPADAERRGWDRWAPEPQRGPLGGAATPWRGEDAGEALNLLPRKSLAIEVARLFKTPTAQLAVNGGSQHPAKRKAGGHGPTLADEVEHLLPTPTTRDHKGRNQRDDASCLTGALLPTPNTHNHQGGRHVEYLDGDANEDLRELRDAVQSQEIQRATRGPGAIPDAAQLRSELRELKTSSDEGRAALAGPQVQGGLLRDVRNDAASSRSPRRQESGEQRPNEPPHSLWELSPEAALARGPREATGVESVGHDWGPYEAAIRRHERALGRSAPPPTETGPKGGQRLSARFVEFLMMLPDGWVTEVPGLTRNEQLKALGNGVVPQQAASALTHLLGIQSERVA